MFIYLLLLFIDYIYETYLQNYYIYLISKLKDKPLEPSTFWGLLD